MSSLPNSPVSYEDPAAAGEDPSLGNAIERVYEAGQALTLRRIDLLVEEFADRGRSLLTSFAATIVGAAVAVGGWFVAVAGIIDVLDDSVPRFAVQIAVGIVHIAVGAVIIQRRERIEKASS
jgi:hypothetical protein